MKRKVVFVLCLVLGGLICLPAKAVVVTPSNVEMPELSGGTFSFDLMIDDSMGVTAASYQSTISVSGPGGLTFDATASQVVASDVAAGGAANYWITGNSIGAFASDMGGNSYSFGDGPSDPGIETLLAGDIMARYAFTWDGTEGDYTFSLDPDISNSFILNGTTFGNDALAFTSGQYPGDQSSFTVTIPEPASLALLALGGLALRRQSRA